MAQVVPLLAAQRIPAAVVRGERNASVKSLRLRLASIKSIQRITKVHTTFCTCTIFEKLIPRVPASSPF
jgi:hypothetical protein